MGTCRRRYRASGTDVSFFQTTAPAAGSSCNTARTGSLISQRQTYETSSLQRRRPPRKRTQPSPCLRSVLSHLPELGHCGRHLRGDMDPGRRRLRQGMTHRRRHLLHVAVPSKAPPRRRFPTHAPWLQVLRALARMRRRGRALAGIWVLAAGRLLNRGRFGEGKEPAGWTTRLTCLPACRS